MNEKFLYTLFLLILIGCSASNYRTEKIRIKGSDTMLYLTELLAEENMKGNPGVSIYVEGGGTAAGIRDLIKGESYLCTASRNLKSNEIKSLAENYGSVGISFMVAKDALSIYLNPANPVKDLSTEDLKMIFTCKIKNWKELGGEDTPVEPVIRNPNSGTYLYFKEHVLNNEKYCKSAIVKSTTLGVIQSVAEQFNAVGYGGIRHDDNIRLSKINGISPTEENARNDIYPITRYLYFYVLTSPGGTIKDFLDWTLSPEGQKIVKSAGYIPLWEVDF